MLHYAADQAAWTGQHHSFQLHYVAQFEDGQYCSLASDVLNILATYRDKLSLHTLRSQIKMSQGYTTLIVLCVFNLMLMIYEYFSAINKTIQQLI